MKDNYFYLGSKIVRLLPRRSALGVKKKANKLGLLCDFPLVMKHRPPISTRAKWTTYEDAILADNYFYLGTRVRRLLRGRTAEAVGQRAAKLGLRCDPFIRFHNRSYQDRLHSQVLAAFGNCCAVPRCNWTDPRVLQLDHINGGGHQERKRIGSQGIYKKALEHPEKFQLLCANHHAIKTQKELYGKGKVGGGCL